MFFNRKIIFSTLIIAFLSIFIIGIGTWAYLPSKEVVDDSAGFVIVQPQIGAIVNLPPVYNAVPDGKEYPMGTITVVNSVNDNGKLLINTVSATNQLGKYLELYAADKNSNHVLIYAGPESGYIGSPVTLPVDFNLPIGALGNSKIKLYYKFVGNGENQNDAAPGSTITIGIIEQIGL